MRGVLTLAVLLSGCQLVFPLAPDEVLVDGGMDTDSDGIADDRDNCPARANQDQGDEDDDGVGDACDNCPVLANPMQMKDADGDHLGAECDPSPEIHCIAVFDGFASLDAWSARTGAWNADDGGAVVDAGVVTAVLISDSEVAAFSVETAGVILQGSPPFTFDVGMDVVEGSTTFDGVAAELRQSIAEDADLAIVRTVNNVPTPVAIDVLDPPGNLAAGEAFVLAIGRTDANVSVKAVVGDQTGGASVSVPPTLGKVAIAVTRATISFSYVLAIERAASCPPR